MTVEVIVKEDYVFQFFGKDFFYYDVKKFSFEDGDLVIDFNDGSRTSFSMAIGLAYFKYNVESTFNQIES